MKRQDDLKEIRELDDAGRLELLSSLRQESMGLRFKHASGQLEKTDELRSIKKRIGRVMTIINEKSREGATA